MRRLITSLLTLLLVIVLTFFLMQIVPGGPFLGENVNPEVTQKLLEKYGYDQPIMVQFGNYIRGLFQGDMGVSMVVKSGDPVTGVIADHFPVSAGSDCAGAGRIYRNTAGRVRGDEAQFDIRPRVHIHGVAVRIGTQLHNDHCADADIRRVAVDTAHRVS